jgi:8-oxo-dGTP pyrophosphatase MutT (NUDIX family)
MSYLQPPDAPAIKLEVLETKQEPDNGFLRINRAKAKFYYPDGSVSEEIIFDQVYRREMDAVVIIAHYNDAKNNEAYVYLRSALRPALALREYHSLPESEEIANQWELPAGLLEADELGLEGLQRGAQRELLEEVGFEIEAKNLKLLGKRVFSSGGIVGERLFFLEVEVDASLRKEPTLDGSPFERNGEVIVYKLREALQGIKDGHFPDAKTEIGLKRLAEIYGYRTV